VAGEAEGFLQDASQRDQPFFMYLAFNAPHDPRQAPQRFLDMYPVEQIKTPVNFLPQYPYKDDIGCSHPLRDEFLAPMPRTEHAVRVHRREYYALITHLDAQIGRILAALEKTDKADNTWIFFTADHGLAVGQHGLMGKQNLYDHSLRVPFIVVGPGVPRNRTSDAPIYYQDVMPTTLELAGIEPPEHVSFQSLLPLIRGEGQSKYPSIYNAYMHLQRCVTQDGWKLLLYPQIKKVRLYHVAEDPYERYDRADDASQAARIKRLFAELLRWQEQTSDSLDLSKAYPELL
jgi:choline-sulfatase